MDNVNFKNLIQEYTQAYNTKQWETLEKIGQQIGLIIGGDFIGRVQDIRELSRIYLGSLLGSGDCLLKKDSKLEQQFKNGLISIENYSKKSNISIETSLTPIIKSAYEIQLFLTKKQSDSRNKAASALRKLSRPDLAVVLTTQQLELTRLNYYSLVVRSAAYSDLSFFSLAISDGQKALKFSPPHKKYFALTTLPRAYINRFQRTGEISDSEIAFDLAKNCFDLKPDKYSANTFLKVIHMIGLPGMESLIQNLRSVQKMHHYELDKTAIAIAKEVLLNSTSGPKAGNLLEVDDLLADELFDNWLDLEDDDDFVVDNKDTDDPEDYFEDYFEDYVDSLNDPQNPHLEP